MLNPGYLTRPERRALGFAGGTSRRGLTAGERQALGTFAAAPPKQINFHQFHYLRALLTVEWIISKLATILLTYWNIKSQSVSEAPIYGWLILCLASDVIFPFHFWLSTVRTFRCQHSFNDFLTTFLDVISRINIHYQFFVFPFLYKSLPPHPREFAAVYLALNFFAGHFLIQIRFLFSIFNSSDRYLGDTCPFGFSWLRKAAFLFTSNSPSPTAVVRSVPSIELTRRTDRSLAPNPEVNPELNQEIGLSEEFLNEAISEKFPTIVDIYSTRIELLLSWSFLQAAFETQRVGFFRRPSRTTIQEIEEIPENPVSECRQPEGNSTIEETVEPEKPKSCWEQNLDFYEKNLKNRKVPREKLLQLNIYGSLVDNHFLYNFLLKGFHTADTQETVEFVASLFSTMQFFICDLVLMVFCGFCIIEINEISATSTSFAICLVLTAVGSAVLLFFLSYDLELMDQFFSSES